MSVSQIADLLSSPFTYYVKCAKAYAHAAGTPRPVLACPFRELSLYSQRNGDTKEVPRTGEDVEQPPLLTLLAEGHVPLALAVSREGHTAVCDPAVPFRVQTPQKGDSPEVRLVPGPLVRPQVLLGKAKRMTNSWQCGGVLPKGDKSSKNVATC